MLKEWYEIFGEPYDALLYYKKVQEGIEMEGESKVCS